MIVCSCNVFTDRDVRATMTAGQDVPRTTGQVYHCLGCSAQCGRCARTIRRIMDEALKHDPEKWQPVFGKDHALAAETACCRTSSAGS